MYYKITDKNSEAYKRFMVYREKMDSIIDNNVDKIKQIIPFEFKEVVHQDSIFAIDGTMYGAFKPLDPTKITKDMVEDKEFPGFYKPNRRTKIGKAIQKAIDELPHMIYEDNNEAFGYHPEHRWCVIGHQSCGDIILFKIPDNLKGYTPLEGSIEITSVEYKQIKADYDNRNI